MDDPQTPPLLVASYRDPMRGISADRFADNFEQDITALRAALLAVSFKKPIRFKFRSVGHVVMPYDPQYLAQLGASVSQGAEAEETIHLTSLGDASEGRLLITADATPLGDDDEAYELALSTPLPASVVVRAPSPEAARALLRHRWDVLERDVLESERDHGSRRTTRLDPDDVEITGVYTRPDLDVGSLPILY